MPVACFVFALIGLALGLSVARDGKMAGFVIGIAVIFAYYVVMSSGRGADAGTLRATEAVKPGCQFLGAHLARWWPNIILGVFGIAR